jgi:ubiquinone/menaquinone biosynthesis C-methylase UbiE
MAKQHLHPVEKAGALESPFRYRFQSPKKILAPYIRSGMIVLDLGCGPGFFTTAIAELLNNSGKVIAADVQTGMLERLRQKIHGTNFEHIIHIHRNDESHLELKTKIDFVLAFYSFHEVTNLDQLISEIKSALQPDAKVLIAEQKFHVSKRSFDDIIMKMTNHGFETIEKPKIFFSRTAVMSLNKESAFR